MPRTRALNTAEEDEARAVFEQTIDLKKVQIADDLGFGGKPWCSPPGWGGYFGHFQLHVGPEWYDAGMAGSALFIHEMTHVWQGVHNVPLWYVLNSGCNQIISTINTGSTDAAYAVDEWMQWKDYNVEQQAAIVAKWYIEGMHSYDWRFPYIDRNIRRGDPNAATTVNVSENHWRTIGAPSAYVSPKYFLFWRV